MRKKINKIKTPVIGALLGSVAGYAYFSLMESGVPKNSNATYLSPISTDLLAWGWGALLVYKGFKYNDPLITFTGSSLISIHVSQFAAHKIIKKRLLKKG